MLYVALDQNIAHLKIGLGIVELHVDFAFKDDLVIKVVRCMMGRRYLEFAPPSSFNIASCKTSAGASNGGKTRRSERCFLREGSDADATRCKAPYRKSGLVSTHRSGSSRLGSQVNGSASMILH